MMYDWSSPSKRPAASLMFAITLLCTFQLLFNLQARRVYGRFRWVPVLCLRLATVVGCGNVMHLVATPTVNVFTFLKNLLMSSGVVVAFLTSFLHREMFHVSWAFSLIQVVVLWQHTPEVCEVGLLTSKYGTQMVQGAVWLLQSLLRLVASMVCLGDHSAKVMIEQPGSPSDMAACVWLLQMLQGIFGLLLPHIILFFMEWPLVNNFNWGQNHDYGIQHQDQEEEEDEEAVGGFPVDVYQWLQLGVLGGSWVVAAMWYAASPDARKGD